MYEKIDQLHPQNRKQPNVNLQFYESVWRTLRVKSLTSGNISIWVSTRELSSMCDNTVIRGGKFNMQIII